jgi:hypothetical protein
VSEVRGDRPGHRCRAISGRTVPGFKPWRRKIRYEQAAEADIHALIERLSFIKHKTKWGAPFRFGFFEISKADFTTIAKRMMPHSSR